jgi:hypothetical protein
VTSAGSTTPPAEKVRTITVPSLVAVTLRRYLRDHAAAGVLFRGLRGAPMLRRDQFYSCGWRAVARHLGDTVETVSRTCVHWLRDDRDIPAHVLDRMPSPGSRARHGASGGSE